MAMVTLISKYNWIRCKVRCVRQISFGQTVASEICIRVSCQTSYKTARTHRYCWNMEPWFNGTRYSQCNSFVFPVNNPASCVLTERNHTPNVILSRVNNAGSENDRRNLSKLRVRLSNAGI